MEGTIFDGLASVATVGGLGAAIWQLYVGNRDRRANEQSHRAERAMRLFEDVVAGTPTAEAFRALSVYLRNAGSTPGTVAWYLPSDADLTGEGVFAPSDPGREEAYANLYTVLWFFERAEASMESNVVDPKAMFKSLGFHMWWWGQVLRDLHAPTPKVSLERLALRAEEAAAISGELDQWSVRCDGDFGGGPAIHLQPAS